MKSPLLGRYIPIQCPFSIAVLEKLGGGSFLGTPEGTKWSPTIVINGWTWCTYQWPKKNAKNICFTLPKTNIIRT